MQELDASTQQGHLSTVFERLPGLQCLFLGVTTYDRPHSLTDCSSEDVVKVRTMSGPSVNIMPMLWQFTNCLTANLSPAYDSVIQHMLNAVCVACFLQPQHWLGLQNWHLLAT